MYSLVKALTWSVRIADRLVFGEKNLTRSQIELRTLACFIAYIVAFLCGTGVVGFMDLILAEFMVWLLVTAPLGCVFIARHQRTNR